MTLTVRLDPELERQLDAACRRRHATKSAVITDLVRQFVAREPQMSSYDVAVKLDVIGMDKSQAVDVARNAKKLVRKAIRAKHHR
jgi:metal-responsive CopG/Arc/MetJ family transcriptional regulator